MSNSAIRPSVYLDHNATTPLSEDFKRDDFAFFKKVFAAWGNPSSIHQDGRGPKLVLRSSRKAIADFIQAEPLEIIFTSGGSEANNLALKGVFEAIQSRRLFSEEVHRRNELIISSVEHPSIVKTAQFLERKGFKLKVLPVSRSGQIDLEYFETLLSPQTALVSVMLANNETGNIFPIQSMVKLAHRAGALFHTDAVQALGKMPVRLKDWGVDFASFSGHKFYALKGCGLLYVRKGLVIESLIHGGGQERGRRAGTENLLAIASFGEMAKIGLTKLEEKSQQMRSLRDHLQNLILSEINEVKVTGLEGERLPNSLSLIIPGVDGETLLMNLDMKGFSVSTGAACSSGSPEPSPVLLAMGLSRKEAQSSLRLSLGWGNSLEEIESFVAALKTTVERLRSFKHGESAAYGN